MKRRQLAFWIIMASATRAFGGGQIPSGILEIVGTPGSGQTDEIYIAHCESDARGEPVRWGCEDLKSYRLNEPLTLRSGVYQVVYYNTPAFAQVRTGAKTVLSLRKLSVSSKAVAFTVFDDLTDRGMQDIFLKTSYSHPVNREFLGVYCQSPVAEDKAACNAVTGENYLALRNTAVRFESDASYSFWAFGSDPDVPFLHRFQSFGRLYITDPQVGGFVSVFPGVYGMVLKNRKTGEEETRYGIRVSR